MVAFDPRAAAIGGQAARSLLTSPYTVPMARANLAQLQAQTQLAQARAQDPISLISGNDPAAQALKLNALKTQYGEQSDVYQNALRQYNAQMVYKEQLAKYLPARFLTQTGKSGLEEARTQQQIAPTGEPWAQAIRPTVGALAGALQGQPQGMLPTVGAQPAQQALVQSGQQLPTQPAGQPQAPAVVAQQAVPGEQAPEFAKELPAQYELLRQKTVTDPIVRQKVLYANNVENTLARMDSSVIPIYSGVKGQAKLLKDSALAQAGTITPDYQRYQQFVADSKLLSSQLRQFYGDSVTPEGMKRIEELANPTSIFLAGGAALERFNAMKDTVRAELKTWQDALGIPEIYRKGKIYPSPRIVKGQDNLLIPGVPNSTQENIDHTAKQLGISTDEVIRRLRQKHGVA